MPTIYLDYAATTPVDPRVIQAMMPYLTEEYGNASSIHHKGRKPGVAVEICREQIARTIQAQSSEIIFTSGGTESNNAALFGALMHHPGKHLVTARSEHNAVLYPVEHTRQMGYEVSYVPLDHMGRITTRSLLETINDNTALVSLMHVNNETGLIHPIDKLSAICRERGILFHCDTVQSVGKIPVNVKDLGVDFMSMSAHKFYGPKGIGALYIKAGTPWSAWMHGGSQERGQRGGTLNTAGIAGMGKALELAVSEMESNRRHAGELKQRFMRGLCETLGSNVRFNSDESDSIEYILSVTFTDSEQQPLDGEMLLLNLDLENICCSNGSACTSGTVKPSHVMLALGYDEAMAKSTLRFSFGPSNRPEDIDKTLETLQKIVRRVAHST